MARLRISPLSTLLCALFLFSSNVFAVSAVLGVDLGTEFIKAALVKPGIPLEIVLTKDSRRKETSAVAFKAPSHAPKSGDYPERVYGSDAMALAARFPGDVFPNLKTLLGLHVDAPVSREYAARHPALVLEGHQRRTIALKSGAFSSKEDAWLVEELLAMELQSIQKNAEALAGSGSTVRSVVITIPPFYTAQEKRAIELAAELAGLRVLSLISDGLAVGLNYATSRTFPNVNEGGKAEHHMVFDMGAGSTKATILKFQGRTVKDVGKYNKTVQEVQVLGSGWDRSLGGDVLNYLIADDMIAQFVASPAAKKAGVTADGVRNHGRAVAKLLKEAERLRNILSANSETQGSFEGLYADVDFKYKITRAAFEEMVASHAERVGTVIADALKMAGLDAVDLDSVILHGGATRTPFVQQQLEKVLGGADKLRTNVNSDEAAVFGAGFRGAELSPSFRVKEIRIADAATYPVYAKYPTANGRVKTQKIWGPRAQLGSAPKEVTLPIVDDSYLEFYQDVNDHVHDSQIMRTTNLTETTAHLVEKYGCEKSDVQFKVAMQLSSSNGEVVIAQAAVSCETDAPEKEGFVDGVKNLFGFGKKDQQPLKEGESAEAEGESTAQEDTGATQEVSASSSAGADDASTAPTASSGAPESTDEAKPATKKTLISVPVGFTLTEIGIPPLPKEVLTVKKDRLKAFAASDRSRFLREEALNQLEAYTYKIRDLLDSAAFIDVSTPDERDSLQAKASDASEWIYGDGSDALREVLKLRLKELQDVVGPIQKRIEEATSRPELIKDLKTAINQSKEFVKTVKEQIAKAEEWSSSQLSSASTTKSSESATTAAPSKDDFDGLEDEDSSSTTTKTMDMDEVLKERGPVPPLYTLNDLKDTEELSEAALAWLEKKEAEQGKLAPSANPVLLSKDIKDWRAKLEKAGVDLAMKGAKNFESKNKKSSSSKSKSKSKKSKTSSAKPADAEATVGTDGEKFVKFGEDSKLTEEEIEALLKRYAEEHKADAKGKEKPEEKHDEL